MTETTVQSVTVQAALFSLVSTAVAQLINAWKQSVFTFDLQPFVTFALLAVIVTPPNHLYQEWLEKTFPTLIADDTQHERKDAAKSLPLRRSKTNVLTKFVIDQTLGAATNTLLFIALSGMFKGNNLQEIQRDVHDNFLQLFMAGWRVWPFVCFANLSFVPWDWRPVVGNTAGLCWGVYLTLMSS